MSGLVEAVIISGSRRGEIVAVPETELQGFSPGDLSRLDEALDKLSAAYERLTAEIKATSDALRENSLA